MPNKTPDGRVRYNLAQNTSISVSSPKLIHLHHSESKDRTQGKSDDTCDNLTKDTEQKLVVNCEKIDGTGWQM